MRAQTFRNDKRNSQYGFSLIEVLVTMAIVAIGLMGLIALMMKGLQANSGSSLRTIATAQAYDMADRMRANLVGVSAGTYNSVIPPGSSSTCPVVGPVGPPTSSLGSCVDCTTAACTVADISARDACMWHQANAGFLPSGSGAICKNAANNWYTISISWDDKKSGTTDTTFQLRFEP
jgi:type IV pilus assembly protein PilV